MRSWSLQAAPAASGRRRRRLWQRRGPWSRSHSAKRGAALRPGREAKQRRSKALAVECDVTDEDQAHALTQRAKDEFGQVDIINNASVMQLSKIEKGFSD